MSQQIRNNGKELKKTNSFFIRVLLVLLSISLIGFGFCYGLLLEKTNNPQNESQPLQVSQQPVVAEQSDHSQQCTTQAYTCSFQSQISFETIPEFTALTNSTTYFSELDTYLSTYFNVLDCSNENSSVSYLGQHDANQIFQGLGRFTNSQGVYLGSFIDSQFDGFGRMNYFNGDSYEGYWTRDKYNGQGTARQISPPIAYTGEFLNHLKHGYGVYVDEYHAYAGDWKDNKKHGNGNWTHSEQNFNYTGEFQNDNMHGYGTFVGERDTYVGDFKVGKRDGEGFLTSKHLIFKGSFLEDMPHGKGHYQYREIGYEYDYIGMFMNGKKHGWAYIDNYSAGYEFEGHFYEGANSGIGRKRYQDGRIEDNCFSEEYDNAYIAMTTDTGEKYQIPVRSMKCKEFEVIVF